jgi:predicted dehydrogenase
MKWLIVGDGIQGKKRKQILGLNCIGILDPISSTSEFKKIEDVKANYDIVAICTSQNVKLEYLKYFIAKGVPCLIEKPFPIISDMEFHDIQSTCLSKNTFVYTAFNHRFEESLVQLRQMILDGTIGVPYYTHMRYGNGTVRDIISSPWKNSSDGLLFDLGSHLIDLHKYIFNSFGRELKIESHTRSESQFPDYVRISGINLVMELGYIFWKSDFRIEIWGSNGSLHATGLKKWGNSKLILRSRNFPSGVPIEKVIKFQGVDNTWEFEHSFVENLLSDNTIGVDSYVQELNNRLLGLSQNL